MTPGDVRSVTSFLYTIAAAAEGEIEITEGEREAARRSCASRAYYTVFLGTREMARALNEPIGDESHQDLWDWLATKDQDLGDRGHAFRKARNRADYKIDRPFGAGEISWYGEMGQLLEAITNLLYPPPA